jgi:citrate lyase alpha subunit
VNNEIKERWISALESGSYAQTTGRLADSGGFCCLGVLCEIAEQDQVVIKRQTLGHDTYVSKINESDNDYVVLPQAVVNWSGLGGENPTFAINPEDLPDRAKNLAEDSGFMSDGFYNTSLADLNDGLGLDFTEIAQVVRKYF